MLVFPVTAYPWKTFVVVTAATVAMPLIVIAVILAAANAVPGWLVILALASAIGLLLSINVGLTALAIYIATRNEITIRGGVMHLKGGEFHERVPLEAVVETQIIDLPRGGELARARRRNGIVLPGFRVGWFQTTSGEWLFVLRGSHRALVYVRTDRHFSALLGVSDPRELQQRLRSPATAQQH